MSNKTLKAQVKQHEAALNYVLDLIIKHTLAVEEIKLKRKKK